MWKGQGGKKGEDQVILISSSPVAFDAENGNDGQPMDGWVNDKLFIIS